MTAKEITDRLSTLSKGLLFPSESEYPLELIMLESATLTPEIILTRSHLVTLSTDWGQKHKCYFC
ncbi:MAG: hypothetical protein IM516_13140 [Pseudanabaena sp. M158S2SP1A06QC]|nr:hypothetical protein [Pseudanabaena sp. M172S2SP2A07QC]MCA6613022.1 hypothetical protein [Pseudanabaena sp. M158S2SP1A06QC]